MSLGALLNFGTNATGFRHKFPGVDVHVLGAKALFRVPFFREWLLAHGGGSVGRSTCELLLSRGESIMIVVGGARESLEAHPETMVLTIIERKGFVRVALRSGAALVPVLSFGENEIFAQLPNPKGSRLRRLQDGILRWFGYTLPSFWGLGSFPLLCPALGIGSFQYGLIPYRRPMTVVVGEPIDVPHVLDPSPELVDEYHAKYLGALQRMYEESKMSTPRFPGEDIPHLSLT
jgi:2-acylglycerol O-acyltransferase 2